VVSRFSLVVLVACTEEQALPPATTLATGVECVTATEDGALWMASEPPFSSVLVHWSRSTGSTEILDRGGGPWLESGAPFIVAGPDGIAWGHSGAFATYGQVRFVTPDGEARDLLTFAQWKLIDQRDGGVVFVTLDAEHEPLQRVDLITGEIETLSLLEGARLGQSIATGEHIYMLVADRAAFVRVFDRGSPTSSTAVARVDFLSAMTASDRDLFWIDNGALGEITSVHRVPIGGLSVETVLELDEHNASAAAWSRDALWMVLYDDSSGSLSRLRDGELSTFATDYEPGRIVSSDSDLLITVYPPLDSGEPALLLRQPLD
jgi:hypothetical protein